MARHSIHNGDFSGPSSTPIQDISEPRHVCYFAVCLYYKPSSFSPPFNNYLLSIYFARA